MSHRHAYIGNVFRRDPSSPVKFDVDGEKLFCPCGYSTEFNPKYVSVQVNRRDVLVETELKSWNRREDFTHEFDFVECPNCGAAYGHRSQLKELCGAKYGHNIARRAMWHFERDGKHALVCFVRQLVISKSTRKLVYSNSRYAIYLNANTRRIYLKLPKAGIVSFGLRSLADNVYRFLSFHRLDNYCEFPDAATISKDMFAGIDSFIASVRTLVEPKDIDRLDASLWDGMTIDYEHTQAWYDAGLCVRRDKLALYFACILYPPLATVAINHGADFLFDFLGSPLMCAPSVLKKANATNYRDMVSAMVEYHLEKNGRNFRYNERLNAIQRTFNDRFSKAKSKAHRRRLRAEFVLLRSRKRHHLYFLDGREWTRQHARSESVVPRSVVADVSPRQVVSLMLKYIGSGCRIPISLLCRKYAHSFVESSLERRRELPDDRLFLHMLDVYSKGNASHRFEYYLDVLRMVNQMELPYAELLHCRDDQQLREYHDRLTADFKLKKSALLDKQFAAVSEVIQAYDCEIDGFRFEHIANVEGMIRESSEMKHCISSYSNAVGQGLYMAFRITGPERATLGIRLRKGIPEFDQLKAVCNETCQKPARMATVKFFEQHGFTIRSGYDDLADTEEELDAVSTVKGGAVIEFPNLNTKTKTTEAHAPMWLDLPF